MPDVTENLLSSIPVGDKVIDPREGIHENATLRAVELVSGDDWYSLKLTFGNLTDANGKEFEHQERITIPNSNSEDFIQRLFLSACHDFEIVPRSFRQRILSDTDDNRQTIVTAFESKIGGNYPLKITINNKTGYPQSRVLRPKKVA